MAAETTSQNPQEKNEALDALKAFTAESKKDETSRSELAARWSNRIESAIKVKKAWQHRFRVSTLYQYYEGYQNPYEIDNDQRPYVVNLIYSTIQQKIPSILFDNPKFVLRPRPYGDSFDLESAISPTQDKEDALNFICSRPEYNLIDKHELAVLDSFFGFGVLETDCSEERSTNPMLNRESGSKLDDVYCKHIPFDRFFVSALANWDLSEGKWWGYYEFIPYSRLKKYVNAGRLLNPSAFTGVEGDFADCELASSGKIVTGENHEDLAPPGTCKIWTIEDFETGKKIKLCLEADLGNRLLETFDFDYSTISTLRFTKRRRGWYPLPPVFQWISPQDEINDIRQTQRIHRKRFSRKYASVQNGGFVDQDEEDKFLYGPDGTIVKVVRPDGIKLIDDGPLDTANSQSLVVSYDDMNRVSGTSDNQRNIADRQTATQAGLLDNNAKIRDSKDLTCVANFLSGFARNVLRALGKTKGSFWISASAAAEGLVGEIQNAASKWKQIPSNLFKKEDYDIDLAISTISPIYQQEDKKNFLEFLAVITQYEIISLSPSLLREAAYRIGYKNSTVLKEFQQFAQLAMIGKQMQAKAALTPAPQGPQGAAPGQLPQQQLDQSTPSGNQDIMNQIFNRGGLQQ